MAAGQASRSTEVRELLREALGAALTLILLYLSIRFMNYSIAALARDTPYVTAGIMAAFFALISLSGAIMVARDTILAVKARKAEGQKTGQP